METKMKTKSKTAKSKKSAVPMLSKLFPFGGKGKSKKLPVPPPKSKESVVGRSTKASKLFDKAAAALAHCDALLDVSGKQQAAEEAKMINDPKKEGIPVALQVQNRTKPNGEEQARIDAAMSKPLPSEKQHPADIAAATAILQENAQRKQTKAQVAKEKKAAASNGAAKALPLTGKAALRAIAEHAVANGKPVQKIEAGETGKSAAKKAAKAAKPAKGKPQGKAQAKPEKRTSSHAKGSAASKNRYDWRAAEEAAKQGKLPAAPDFSAPTHKYYRPLLAEAEKLVKARDLKGLQGMRFTRDTGSPAAVKHYRDIAIMALKAC
jgi:hypothetical protein